MLETKNLYKTYRPKKGVPVTALDDITIKFPEKGMVFLLGKSGSGKSTMLNVLGGLDRYDSGEIDIKGVSSKNFDQQHFDSYRNTYVGFIFQEYNVLDEFTVGANIALAIELQGRKADDELINAILKEVDLEGYGDRKPNELSGGQKQRVAIARALVKKPEIIMADEPTGALDSATGKQVFDTLKKLSENKLIIVVSHDREFAEQYADRIIELADGKVISDVELELDSPAENETEAKLYYSENCVEIPSGYHLTEDDRKAINDYIDSIKDGNVKLNVNLSQNGKKKFSDTDNDKIIYHNKNDFKLIKSKLPLKNAFKIGASGLKYKKIRLVFTIILSCVAFGLFGLADTFAAYNHIKTCTKSIMDTGVTYTSIEKSKKFEDGTNKYWRNGYNISDENLKDFKKETGIEMTGVYSPINTDLSFAGNINPDVEFSKSDYNIYQRGFTGFAEITEHSMDDMNMKFAAGNLPDGTKDEIAISKLVFETFKVAGYWDGTTVKPDKDGVNQPVYQSVENYSDMIGKTIQFGGKKFTITGIIDTNMDIDRYRSIIEDHSKDSNAQMLITYALAQEFFYTANYSFATTAMVGEGYVEKLIESRPVIVPIMNGYLYYNSETMTVDPAYMAKLDEIKEKQKIVWLDGEKTSLSKNEIIVTSDLLVPMEEKETADTGTSVTDYKTLLGNNNFELWGHDGSYKEVSLKGCKIVGVIPIDEKNTKYSGSITVDDGTFEQFTNGNDGSYNMAVGAMPTEKSEVSKLVAYCYDEESDIRYNLMNSVTFELDTVNEVLQVCSKIFLYIGLGFALFAALMLANFIATSISHKKQDIGILRAIGSRSNDVFRIFFSESFIIAMINFVLSSIGVFVATIVINYFIRRETGVLITVLGFGIRQVLLLLAVSIIVAVISSFFPVKRIASKRPIDAIRNK